VSLAVDIFGFVSAIVIFIITSRSDVKVVKDQVRRESVRAILTEFANIRRTHHHFERDMTSENRVDVLKGYLSDLERFAVGCNLKAYAVDVVNSISGGILVNQY
jgi:hypothetical protein